MHAVSRDKYLPVVFPGELAESSLINHVEINSFDFDSNIFVIEHDFPVKICRMTRNAPLIIFSILYLANA